MHKKNFPLSLEKNTIYTVYNPLCNQINNLLMCYVYTRKETTLHYRFR